MYFLQLAFAHVCARVRIVELLSEARHSFGSGCIGQKSEFIEVFGGLGLALPRSQQAYENRTFGCFFAKYKIFHIWETRKPARSSDRLSTLVAGAGLEPTTFGL